MATPSQRPTPQSKKPPYKTSNAWTGPFLPKGELGRMLTQMGQLLTESLQTKTDELGSTVSSSIRTTVQSLGNSGNWGSALRGRGESNTLRPLSDFEIACSCASTS